MPDLSTLSEQQRQIYDLLAEGKTPAQIATALHSTEGLIKANMTRIVNRGIDLPAPGAAKSPMPATHVPVDQVLTPPAGPPPATGGSQNDVIAQMISTAGKALSADELRTLADKVAGSAVREVHPMILLGVTIQYVKLCGGRMVAHQVIEDVYSALRMFVGTSLPDDGGETVKLPETDKERLAFLEEQVAKQQDLIRQLEAKLRARDPSWTGVN